MLCWAALGLPVVPLVYMRKRIPSAGMTTGSTRLPRKSRSRSSMKKSRPSTMGVPDEYFPGSLLQTSTLSTFCPASSATLIATSAFDLWSRSWPLR